MDSIRSIFETFVKRYFDIMSKKSSQTTENRVTSLEKLKEEFLTVCYSPSVDMMHVLFLGLLNDAKYMLKEQITQNQNKTKKNEIRVPDNENKELKHYL